MNQLRCCRASLSAQTRMQDRYRQEVSSHPRTRHHSQPTARPPRPAGGVVIRRSLCTTPPLVKGTPPAFCGRFEKSTGPFHEGVVDCGLFEKSTGPFHEGVVDCGLSKTAEPCRGGGVVQSDVRISAQPARGTSTNERVCVLLLGAWLGLGLACGVVNTICLIPWHTQCEKKNGKTRLPVRRPS